MATDNVDKPREFALEKHVKFFKRSLEFLPYQYSSADTNRMTLGYFCINGLDLLGKLDILSEEQKKGYIEWIYAQQIHPDPNSPDENKPICGFRGSPFAGSPYAPSATNTEAAKYDRANLAMTYTALLLLLALGDDLSRVNRKAIIESMPYLQREDGSFCPCYESRESDMRFLYCASVVSYILNDWTGIDIPKALSFIKSSQAYDYGIGQGPSQESHGGSTYCAVAVLDLLEKLDSSVINQEKLLEWCLNRQETGFQGRRNKPADSCYSFWIGATIKMLGGYELIDFTQHRAFLMTTQGGIGGFAKWPDVYPDLLHAYMAIAGLSFMNEPGINPVNPTLNCSLGVTEALSKSVFHREKSMDTTSG
ncbi:geranylgeranyl transferase type-1 subunit beta-like protein [Basidiobolus meristosporus CBS 931.73]|uniref:Geranylgeranyl transferase type-1 subunit beta n=1 Tax=Basidiobolus meristosporus CBS 931.73 TaxID=1314790 RepID=A0A1Y1XS44_9FUNG|nr:geranylgeranyl transferase type-1 subunit beta-like protein [Basidiobolus meristosporus CBS 931.73]|eukprot:ORX88579.1 geranylgeranyl transferase type-1 subunit beta-like protein [Basidiobolus meristosporus CBS 931.73]